MSSLKMFNSSFSLLEDPRVSGLITYPLNEILLCALCGIMCRCEDWDEISCWSSHHIKWLKQFFSFNNGAASAQTFSRVFNSLDSKQFNSCFEYWVSNFHIDYKNKHIAIDGKTIRGSKRHSTGDGAAHILSAFVHDKGLVIGSEKVDNKSNEITAIPLLLQRLALEGSIITIDAMGTQTEIVTQITNKKADYVLSLKANQKNLHSDVELFMKDQDIICDEYEDTDADHGRIEIRNCRVTKDIEWLKARHPEWKNLRSIAMVDSVRINKKTLHEQRQKRLFISSLDINAANFLSYVRNHWSIENKLHWVLDMRFKEDSCRTRINHGAENFSIMRKMAFNLIKTSKTAKKISVKKKMLKANWDLNYLKSLLIDNNL